MSKVYSVRDNDIGSYNFPFYAKTDVEAIRQVTVAAQDNQGMLKKFPASFGLYLLGNFDESNGVFENLPEPKMIKPISQMITLTSEELRDATKGK